MLQDEQEEYVFEMKPQQEVQADEIEEEDEDQYTFEVKRLLWRHLTAKTNQVAMRILTQKRTLQLQLK